MTDDGIQISDRERQILEVVATGASNHEIAQELNISVHTVKVHLRNIYSKIGVQSRAAATRYAVEHGLVHISRQSSPDSVPATEFSAGDETSELDADDSDSDNDTNESEADGGDVETQARYNGTGEYDDVSGQQTSSIVVSAMPSPESPSANKPETQVDTSQSEIADGSSQTALALSQATPVPLTPATPETIVPATTPTSESAEKADTLAPTDQTVSNTHHSPRTVSGFAHSPLLLIGLAVVSVVLTIALVYTLLHQTQSTVATPTIVTQEATDTIAQIAAPERWTEHTAMLKPRTNFAATAYDYDGKMYIIGGSVADAATAVVERYDPVNDVWVTLEEKPTAVSHIQAVTLGGLIYVPGGENANGNVLDIFEVYDPRSQNWMSLPSLPSPRSHYALASFEGQIYLFGGWDGQTYCADVFIYNPIEEQWYTGQQLARPRRNAGAAVAEDRIYVIGGEDEYGPVQVNERYDTTTSAGDYHWQSAAPLPVAIAHPSVASIISSIFVFDAQRHQMLRYNPSTDAWHVEEIPAHSASPAQVVALRSSIFVFGLPVGNKTGKVSEYHAMYEVFLPEVSR